MQSPAHSEALADEFLECIGKGGGGGDDDRDSKDGQLTPSRKNLYPSLRVKAKAKARDLASNGEDSQPFHSSPSRPRGDSLQRNRSSGDRDGSRPSTRKGCDSRGALFSNDDFREEQEKFLKCRANFRQVVLDILKGQGPIGIPQLIMFLNTQPSGTRSCDIGLSVSRRRVFDIFFPW